MRSIHDTRQFLSEPLLVICIVIKKIQKQEVARLTFNKTFRKTFDFYIFLIWACPEFSNFNFTFKLLHFLIFPIWDYILYFQYIFFSLERESM